MKQGLDLQLMAGKSLDEVLAAMGRTGESAAPAK
jgi:hypothetical protein